MAQPYVGEIRMFAGTFAPAGWMLCAGQLLPISENETLFQLIGTTYGGDGQNTFALPDLQSRVPIHFGNGFTLAENGGVETVTLSSQQMPVHSHPMPGSTNAATTADPTNNILSTAPLATTFPYGTDNPLTPLAAKAVSTVGGSQPHSNIQPYGTLNYIISLFGIFPSQT